MMMMINIIGININIIVTCVKDDVAGKIKISETGLYSYDASIVERLNISTALIAFIDPVSFYNYFHTFFIYSSFFSFK